MEFKYKKILWAEDYPHEIVHGVLIAGKSLGLTTESLLSRVTFALDLEEASSQANSREFDLYISDGDYPDCADREHKELVLRTLREFRALGESFIEPSLVGADSGDNVQGNFLNFYKSELVKLNIPRVVFSVNKVNSILAFHQGLPFYIKGNMDAGALRAYVSIRPHYLLDHQKKPNSPAKGIVLRDLNQIASWECGNLKDFVENYLL